MKIKTLTFYFLMFLCISGDVFAQAEVQVIHNSADLSITTVDVYMNTDLFFDDAIFRSCSQFQIVPAGPTDVVIAVSNSTDTTNALYRNTINLANGTKYVLVLNGILSSSGYNPPVPFEIHELSNARDSALTSGNIDILFFHGVTDEGNIDVRDLSSGVYFNNVSYGAFDGYNSQPISDITLRVTEPGGALTLGSYLLPAASFGFSDVAVTVVYSGFDDPSMNSNAPFPASLWMALPVGGGLIDLPVVTGLQSFHSPQAEIFLYPNPTSSELFININLSEAEEVQVEIFDVLGASVYSDHFRALSNGPNQLEADVSSLREGIYFCRISSGNSVLTKKVEVRH